ncbi:MAG: excinuclease ABC subunit UvrC [Oceanococcus sp.]
MAADAPGFDAQAFTSQLSTQPGVYRMLSAADDVLYVGKARNLKKRVSSYFLRASGNPRIESMVDQIANIEVSITGSEDEALLLESSLIKSLRPRYNVCLRDDKSYPYLRLSGHVYPRIVFHRGARKKNEQYFGPFPSAATVRDTISTLQKVFEIRGCSDSYFEARTRPCLQHQIRRCSAPCVNRISAADYAGSVQAVADVLHGRTDSLLKNLQSQMDEQAGQLDFEAAARSRDRIAAIRRMQETRVVTGLSGDVDFVVLAMEQGLTAVGIMSIRSGQNRGQSQHFPKVPKDTPNDELMSEFLAQHYTSHKPPPELIVNIEPADREWLEHALAEAAGHKLHIRSRVRDTRRRLRDMASTNLVEAIKHRALSKQNMGSRLIALQQRFALERLPQRLECFDISHSRGEETVASCVVFGQEGANKSEYRRFLIKDITPGDDYAAMYQAVSRRFQRVAAGESPCPDVLLIDGGKGQLSCALKALEEQGVHPSLIIGVAKGSSRKAGLEQLFLPGAGDALRLDNADPALHLIQQVRDESHRFAISGHRARRGKARTRSELDDIPGLGPVRRQNLLRRFGGLRQLRRASLEELQKVDGLHRELAQRVYDRLHENSTG